MRLTKRDLEVAVKAGLLQESQAQSLWDFLGARSLLNVRTVAYFFGGFLIITALSVFFVTGWAAYGGPGILTLSLLYIAGLVYVSETLARQEGLEIPRGVLLTAAVCIVPLAIYGLQESLGWWHGNRPGTYRDFHVWVRSGWLWMELGTIAAGLAALKRFRFPFLMFPIAFVLWYLSMDLTPILYGDDFSWVMRRKVSVAFGAAVIVAAYVIDWKVKEDLAFWLYLSGLIAFWGGLTSMDSGSEWGKFFYALINLLLLAIGIVLQRRAFLVFGAIGIFLYLGHLAWDVFKDAILFTLALSGLGWAVILAAMKLHRNAPAVAALRERWVPAGLSKWVPPRR